MAPIYSASIDESNVNLLDGKIRARVIVTGPFEVRHVFEAGWRLGREDDWFWSEEESWLQTELNAERVGINSSQLIHIIKSAITDFSQRHQPSSSSSPSGR